MNTKTSGNIWSSLVKACKFFLKMAKPPCQYLIVKDAIFHGAGFMFFIEEAQDSLSVKCKTYAPVASGSQLFTPAQLKRSIQAKEFLSVQLNFEKFKKVLHKL